jgi:hypothetical protein
LLSLALKAWLFAHTDAIARDGIVYILIANRYEQGPFLDVLRQTQQHPLFPLSVLGLSHVVHPLYGGESAVSWQRSAQLANILSSLLLVFPVYFLGKELGGRGLAFWATLLFQCLPVFARLSADGVSEGTYLLWTALTLYGVVRGFRTGSIATFFLGGVSAGLAYLTRPEAALVILAALGILLFARFRGTLTWNWRRVGACSASFVMAAALVASPYWLAIGRLSNKPSVGEVIEGSACLECPPAPQRGVGLLLAARFMEGVDGEDWSGMGPLQALWEVLDEVGKALLYVLWLPALVGLVWFRREFLTRPALALIAAVLVLNLLLLWRLAIASRYVSERHTLLIVLCASYLALLTLFRLTDWLAATWDGEALKDFIGRYSHRLLIGGLGALMLWGTIRTLRPLHAGRKVHRQAAEWFVQNRQPGDVLVDPYGFARFYAEQEPELAKPTGVPCQRRFLLVEPADLDGLRNRIIAEATSSQSLGQPIAVWPDAEKPRLLMYFLKRNGS